MYRLPRIVGGARARELSLLPRKLTADEAAELGLVNATFDDGDLLDEVCARAARLAGSAPLARRALKSHYVEAEPMGLAEFVKLETERHLRISTPSDCREASSAFVEKRPASFTSR